VGDGQSEASDIAKLFARKYRELYTSVSYNVAETQQLSNDLSSLLCDAQYELSSDTSVSISDVEDAINKLMSGKSYGSVGLSSEYHNLHGSAELL